jgi:poly-gamma-glutamate synthesis protein (capsule biosynthesis protein)
MRVPLQLRINRILLAACLAVLGSFGAAAGNNPERVSLLFGGDMMLDRGVRMRIRHIGVEKIFEQVSPIFRQSDYVLVNLESAASKRIIKSGNSLSFCSDPAWFRSLRDVHITHLNLANNHAMDQGTVGLESTVDSLQRDGLGIIGCGRKGVDECEPSIIQTGKFRFAIFGSVQIPLEGSKPAGKQYAPCQASGDELCRMIRAHKARYPDDIVIVTLHWGLEYHRKPTDRQRQEARRLIDSGAAAVIGHHPHVMQPMEFYKNAPIIYSLGNLVFDQHDAPTKKMIMVQLIVDSGRIDSVLVYPMVSKQNVPCWATRSDGVSPVVEGGDSSNFFHVLYRKEENTDTLRH